MNSIDSLTNYKNNVNSSQTELHSAVYLTFCPNQKNKLHKINFWAVMNCKQTATKLQFIFNNLSNRDELQSSCTTTLRVRRTATTVMENLAAKQKELQVAQHRTAPVKLHDGNAKSKICKKKKEQQKNVFMNCTWAATALPGRCRRRWLPHGNWQTARKPVSHPQSGGEGELAMGRSWKVRRPSAMRPSNTSSFLFCRRTLNSSVPAHCTGSSKEMHGTRGTNYIVLFTGAQ